MGTDVNPVAWENADIAASLVYDNKKGGTLADAFLYFCSYTSASSGDFSVKTGTPMIFKVGDAVYETENTELNGENLTRLLYVVFYKHRS